MACYRCRCEHLTGGHWPAARQVNPTHLIEIFPEVAAWQKSSILGQFYIPVTKSRQPEYVSVCV